MSSNWPILEPKKIIHSSNWALAQITTYRHWSKFFFFIKKKKFLESFRKNICFLKMVIRFKIHIFHRDPNCKNCVSLWILPIFCLFVKLLINIKIWIMCNTLKYSLQTKTMPSVGQPSNCLSNFKLVYVLKLVVLVVSRWIFQGGSIISGRVINRASSFSLSKK